VDYGVAIRAKQDDGGGLMNTIIIEHKNQEMRGLWEQILIADFNVRYYATVAQRRQSGDTSKYAYLKHSYQMVGSQLRKTLVSIHTEERLIEDLLNRSRALVPSLSLLQDVEEPSTDLIEKLCEEVTQVFPPE
jgi:hypothetical protein